MGSSAQESGARTRIQAKLHEVWCHKVQRERQRRYRQWWALAAVCLAFVLALILHFC